MYRSRQSHSTPRLRPGSAPQRSTSSRKSTTPLRDRPEWNDTTVGDTDKYKLTPEQMARKKQQRVSKNMVSLRASKQAEEWGSAVKQHGSPDAHNSPSPRPADPINSSAHGVRSNSGTPDGQQRRSETPSSPPINYAAVLQMLNRHREEGLHSPNRFSPGAERPSSAPNSAQPAPAPHTELGSSGLGLQPEFDATMGGFSRLDLSSSSLGPHGQAHHPSTTAAGAHTNSERATATFSAGVAGAVPHHSDAPLPHSSSSHDNGGSMHAPPLSMGAAMDSMWEKQHGMNTRLTGLEDALMRHQSQAVRSEDLQDVRATVKQLAADQARMRADLSNFSNHATQLMSVMQAQLQQLLKGGQGTQHHQHQQDHHQHQHHQVPTPQGLVPHLNSSSTGVGGAGPTLTSATNYGATNFDNANFGNPPPPQPPPMFSSMEPHVPPKRSLFMDLPEPSSSPMAPLRGHARVQSDLDDSQLALPSYAAMRRSAAGITHPPPITNPAHPAPPPRPFVSTTPPHPYPPTPHSYTPASSHISPHPHISPHMASSSTSSHTSPPGTHTNTALTHNSHPLDAHGSTSAPLEPRDPHHVPTSLHTAANSVHALLHGERTTPNNMGTPLHGVSSSPFSGRDPLPFHSRLHAALNPPSEVASSLASIHAPTHAPAMGLGPRIMPSSFQPRALGTPPPQTVGDASQYLGQGEQGAVAAAGGNLANLGMDLPAHRLGGPALGRLSVEEAGHLQAHTTHSGDKDGPSPGGVGGIRGMPSSFGTHHPEPLLFDVASDFKIVRVGNAGGASTGKGGMPENSLSYAAHVAAAARQREARAARG